MNVRIEKWEEFQAECNSLSRPKERWIFRGHQSSDWKLSTTLERTLNRLTPSDENTREAESFLLREFKRHFHRYSQSVPHEDDTLEWLALMQHHGAPTRLLDWTFSEYVALFFALDGVAEGCECMVWAVNQKQCWEKFKSELPEEHLQSLNEDDKDRRVLNWALNEFPNPLICPLNPFRLNDRLAIQRGTFLVPLDPNRTFMDNFNEPIGRNEALFKKMTIQCSRDFLHKALTELHKMNISNVTLFPGIDGFARSLNTTVLLPHLRPQI